MKYFRIIFVISLLTALIGFFSRCVHNGSSAGNDPRGDQYADPGTCASCHKNEFESQVHGFHNRTSSPVDKDSLKHLIAPSKIKDRLYFLDSSYVSIEENDSGLFQSGFSNGSRDVSGGRGGSRDVTGRFDIALGSGEKAQTYGFWKENKLHQLPLTWYTSMKTWANSPGFSPRHARFERIISSRCFECHASYVKRSFEKTGALSVTETLDKSSIVYGIDCQRCHGPAQQHVKFQQDNPDVKTARYIVPIRSLTRQRQLDICAACHSGNDLTTQRSLFTFVPGDTLSHFYYPEFQRDEGEPDVHGKQLQLLQASRCYQKTNMTCTTCHDLHASGSARMEMFVARCIDCHAEAKHTGVQPANSNCIGCHMPLQTSKLIHFNNGAELKDIPYLIRTHKIAIYQ